MEARIRTILWGAMIDNDMDVEFYAKKILKAVREELAAEERIKSRMAPSGNISTGKDHNNER